ncbi:Uncharacterised protein [Bordetella pertussis]|nr:Uncharacterised protein [Bordetella pertussis]
MPMRREFSPSRLAIKSSLPMIAPNSRSKLRFVAAADISLASNSGSPWAVRREASSQAAASTLRAAL